MSEKDNNNHEVFEFSESEDAQEFIEWLRSDDEMEFCYGIRRFQTVDPKTCTQDDSVWIFGYLESKGTFFLREVIGLPGHNCELHEIVLSGGTVVGYIGSASKDWRVVKEVINL